MDSQDFSHRTKFPGNTGNNFDFMLRITDALEAIPAPLFAAILLCIAVLGGRLEFQPTAILYTFLLSDWVLLALLPYLGVSYGPSQPTMFLLAILRSPFALLPYPWWILLELVGTALVIYSFWFEPHTLLFHRETLTSPKLGLERPLKLLHLGDLHVERLTGREAQLLDLVEEADADVILFSGDLLNLSYTNDPLAAEHARRVLRQIRAPLGVYAVSGSPAVDPPEVVANILNGLDHIRWLEEEVAVVEHEGKQIEIIGISCTHRPFIDGPRLLKTMNGGGSERFRILLYHTPDLAPEASRAGIDMQLSGHTHGGQVRLPFYGALYAASLYGKAFESGRRQIGGLTLFVTRGIGLEGGGAPRVRFNCPPQVILWEIS